MSSLFSTYWYRVAEIKPRLQNHVRLLKHMYRRKRWYILQDPSSNRQHRFNKGAYQIISRMDGEQTVQQIWDRVNTVMGDDAPSQDDVIRLLGQLHSSDLMQSDIAPDVLELYQRQKKQTNQWKQKFLNPFAVRFPLVNPSPYLEKFLFLTKPFVGWLSLFFWCLTVGFACILAALHWPDLTNDVAARVLTPENLLLLWGVYPFVKCLHELSHAFICRVWGGEVNEMGIMVLVMTPLPYVDASSSSAFTDKKKRMGVAAAGVMAELFLASLALFVWLNVEPGQVSAIAYNVMLIGGISTIAFNGNPLLRYDGYYILSDFIEIPNLAQRSQKYLAHLFKYHILGMQESVSPVTARGEAPWFVFYGIASFCYRMVVLAAIVLLVSSKFYILGILIALWGVGSQLLLPAGKNITGVWNSIEGRRNRSRLLFVFSSLTGVAGVLLFLLPAPLSTKVEGVVVLPDYANVRAHTDCVISEIVTPSETYVRKDELLFRCNDPFLGAQVQVLKANLEEVQARYDAEPLRQRVKREILKEEVQTAQIELEHVRKKMEGFDIYSPHEGHFLLPEEQRLLGRFVRQGEQLGYVIGGDESTVVLVVKQSDIGLVRKRTENVQLRLAGDVATVINTSINREIPAASNRLPSPILGTAGGGEIPVNPSDPDGLQTLQKTFQVEVGLPVGKKKIRVGEKVYALFDHGYEPLAYQWFRSLRRLFLRQFNV